MAGTLIPRKPKIEVLTLGADRSVAGNWTVITTMISKFGFSSKRDENDDDRFLDIVKLIEKGLYTNAQELAVKPPDFAGAWGVDTWTAHVLSDENTVFRYTYNRDLAVGPENRVYEFEVALTTPPMPGASRNDAIMFDGTFRINSPIKVFNDADLAAAPVYLIGG